MQVDKMTITILSIFMILSLKGPIALKNCKIFLKNDIDETILSHKDFITIFTMIKTSST